MVSEAAQAALRAITGARPNTLGQQQQQQQAQLHVSPRRQQTNPNIHPQFRGKSVCRLLCASCDSKLCERGMRAILLGNIAIELYSTDIPPLGVALVFNDYLTRNCACRIRDAACLGWYLTH